MAFGTLFALPDNPRCTALKVIANANKLDLKIVEVDLANVTAEHLKAHPLGKVPAFIGDDGFILSECIAVAIYLASQNEKTTLLGKTKQDYASILRWMSFFNSEFVSPMGNWYLPLVGKIPYNKKSVDDSSKAVLKAMKVVEKHLLRRTYLVGERITLADLFCTALVYRGFQYFFDKQWRQEHPNVTRWYETMVNQPVYLAVAKKLDFLDKPALTNAPPKKAEQPKAAQAAAPKPVVAAAAAEEEAAPAPKPKHPCDLLPKAAFPLDEWKRYYSNNETADALKWFWENVPSDEYSIWRCDYKYNDELTLTFMSNNLIGGFNTRLEASRKYLFGCASVYGENNNSVIQGAFVIRGQDFEPVFDVAPDFESYTFTKLDPKKAGDREFLEAQWSWDRPTMVQGKTYEHADGKVFK